VSVGPFLEALGAAVSLRNRHLTVLFELLNRYGHDFEYFQENTLPFSQPSLLSVHIQVLFSALVLPPAPDFLNLQLEIPSQVVQLIENLRQPAQASRKARSESKGNCLASPASSPPHQRGSAFTINSLGRRTLSASIPREPTDGGQSRTGSESTYAGQVATPKSLCPRLSRKRSARRNDRDRARCRARTEAVSGRIAKDLLCCPPHPWSPRGFDRG
jgi:hypothetical protein